MRLSLGCHWLAHAHAPRWRSEDSYLRTTNWAARPQRKHHWWLVLLTRELSGGPDENYSPSPSFQAIRAGITFLAFTTNDPFRPIEAASIAR